MHPNHQLVEFHGGFAPNDAYMYFNQRAECWGRMREWLKTGSIPADPEMDDDLTGLTYGFSSKNQIQLERKEDMKKRGLSSPDLSDNLAMSFYALPAAQTAEEKLLERIEQSSPLEAHWIRYRETVKRRDKGEDRGYWND